MRLWIKLIAVVLLAASLQWEIERHAGWLDEAQFAVRVYVMTAQGKEPNQPEMLVAADQLLRRQRLREDPSYIEPGLVRVDRPSVDLEWEE